ncbi:MAG TPA: N-acetyl-gamma-glutamyl-phosphate reductase, partial [Burkholderiaceae bacterium]|nr:N-acetyl-gamma-glutamyl-phosphate reductase [Burkholderiaceae bacterium]
KMIEQYEAGGDARLDAPRPYALGLSHKHLPEMTAHTGLRVAPLFMPMVGKFYKGLSVSVPLHFSQLSPGATAGDLQAALERRYAGERFVRVMPLRDPATLAEGFFDVQASNDTNRVDLFVFAGDTQAVLMARLDNLGKGASGSAVQAMNVHLGLDEGLGL